MVRADTPRAGGEHLLHEMLHNFRRIYAAKPSLRGRLASISEIYVSQFNGLKAIASHASNCGMLHLCCGKSAA
jgi:hypothetical protein